MHAIYYVGLVSVTLIIIVVAVCLTYVYRPVINRRAELSSYDKRHPDWVLWEREMMEMKN